MVIVANEEQMLMTLCRAVLLLRLLKALLASTRRTASDSWSLTSFAVRGLRGQSRPD